MGRGTTRKGEATHRHIFTTALSAIRDRGFAQTSMRDIARSAGLSLGATYHYFDSKDAIIAEYYAWMQQEHETRVAALPATDSIAARLKLRLRTKLDLLRSDRKILVALFTKLTDPEHALSLFGPDPLHRHHPSIALFQAAFVDSGLPEELEAMAGYAAWMVHLGVLLYFVHDRSKGQQHTQRLADAVGDLFGVLVPLAVTPAFAARFARAAELARTLSRSA